MDPLVPEHVRPDHGEAAQEHRVRSEHPGRSQERHQGVLLVLRVSRVEGRARLRHPHQLHVRVITVTATIGTWGVGLDQLVL